ncbi:MAG: hypothetical protein JNK72_20630 [Myxococcales bacterium]|nr:hypothetical protein [Myxococcales bacterium]
MGFFAFERRWLAVILPAYAGASEGLVVAEGEVDWLGAADAMLARSHPQARLGMHLATWVVWFAPGFLGGGASTLGAMAPEARGEFLSKMLGDARLGVRGMALMLKLTACMAMFKSAAVRGRSGYDLSETRFSKRALPVVSTGAP